MTFAEKNTLIRTVFLGVSLCALMVLLFQVSAAVTDIVEELNALSASSALLIDKASDFVPEQTIDVAKINGAIASAGELLRNGNRTVRKINAPCVPGPCGLLADGAKTLNTARMTMGQVEIAAFHEDKNLGALDKQEAAIFDDTNADLQAFHALVASPDLLQTMHNLDATSSAFADSAKQADVILTDGRIEADKFTHPSKKKITFWGAILATGQTLQKLSPPLF